MIYPKQISQMTEAARVHDGHVYRCSIDRHECCKQHAHLCVLLTNMCGMRAHTYTRPIDNMSTAHRFINLVSKCLSFTILFCSQSDLIRVLLFTWVKLTWIKKKQQQPYKINTKENQTEWSEVEPSHHKIHGHQNDVRRKHVHRPRHVLGQQCVCVAVCVRHYNGLLGCAAVCVHNSWLRFLSLALAFVDFLYVTQLRCACVG